MSSTALPHRKSRSLKPATRALPGWNPLAADRIFSGLTLAAGLLILLTLAAVVLFLLAQALPVLTADPAQLIGSSFLDYIIPLIIGTLIASGLALLCAAPLGIGVALFISHYAPRRLAQALGYLIDLLAAIPSVIFGAWGAAVLAPQLVPAYDWLASYLGFIPIFEGPASQTGKTILTAGLVLGMMILPIITSM